MDRAYCVSLQRNVDVHEAVQLYRSGMISRKDDFACIDPACRASYICINLGKVIYKVSPYFRTADNPERRHAEGCIHEVEDKKPTAVAMGQARKPRLPISDDTEVIFESSRPKSYFTAPAPYVGGGVVGSGIFKYIPNGYSDSNSGVANPKCYSIERLLNGGWGDKQRVVLEGHSETIKSIVRPVDNYKPDEYRKYIYCGLARVSVSVSEDGFYIFKFGRSFGVGSRMVDVYLKLAQTAITSLVGVRSLYYKGLIEQIVTEAKNVGRYPRNPFFIYALGLPKLDADSRSYFISVDSLDHFYIESRCSRHSLIGSEYSDWERNQYYFLE